MKHLFHAAAVIAASLCLASCDDILKSIATQPVFTPASETAYDGQEMVMKRSGTCCYGWSVSEGSSYVSIKVYKELEGIDSVAVATIDLSSLDKAANETTAVIKAFNTLHPDYTTEQNLKLHRWSFNVENVNTPGTSVNALKEGETYKAYIYDLATKEPIKKVVYNAALSSSKKAEEVITWSVKADSTCQIIEESNVSITFKFGGQGTSTKYNLKAALGTASATQSFTISK